MAQPAPTVPNQVWVGVITYLPKQGGGWLYLATWLNRYSRKIVDWDVPESMSEDLVSEAPRRALAARWPCASQWLGSSCIPTSVASTPRPTLSSY